LVARNKSFIAIITTRKRNGFQVKRGAQSPWPPHAEKLIAINVGQRKDPTLIIHAQKAGHLNLNL
jgi:hypothetical protein